MEFNFKDKGDFNKVKLGSKPEFKTLSDQALGAIMMALQSSLMHQTDIVPVLKGLKIVDGPNDELVVLNPPILRADTDAKV